MVDRTDALRGKTALVTGAGTRLGRAIAKALSGQGVNVLVHYNQSAAAAKELCEEIRRARCTGPGFLACLFANNWGAKNSGISEQLLTLVQLCRNLRSFGKRFKNILMNAFELTCP